MEFLHFLEGIRFPFLDKVMLFITNAGDETVFIIIAMVYLWCIDKFDAYYLLFVGFCTTALNNLVKAICKVPRPWVRDPSLTAVTEAMPAATGYSFPSGHTQSSVGTFGVVAVTSKKNFLKIIAILIAFLVGFSRLYLGVHTPADVLTGALLSIILVTVIGLVFKFSGKTVRTMHILFAVCTVLFLIQALFLTFTLDLTDERLLSGVKTTYKMLGCILGMFTVYEIDRRFINYQVKAPLPVQFIKVALGLAVTLGVKELCYLIFSFISFEPLSRLCSYFVMVIFAGAVWPLTFPLIKKLFSKKETKNKTLLNF